MAEYKGPVIASNGLRQSLSQAQDCAGLYRAAMVLGTDGYGRSDLRSQLRSSSKSTAYYVVLAALTALREADERFGCERCHQEVLDRY